MTLDDINAQIQIKQTQLRVERDSNNRQELNKELKVLQLQKEIETIRLKIAQLS